MTYNVYAVRDVVADDTICMFYATTDGMAVRDNLPALSRVRPVADLRLYCVATFDSKTMIVKSFSAPVSVSWDSYKFPESKGESVGKKDDKKDDKIKK